MSYLCGLQPLQLDELDEPGGEYPDVAGHSPAHSVAPVASEYRPAAQSLQGVLGSLSESACPGSHATHSSAVVEPAVEDVPIGHALHCVDPDAVE